MILIVEHRQESIYKSSKTLYLLLSGITVARYRTNTLQVQECAHLLKSHTSADGGSMLHIEYEQPIYRYSISA